MRNVQKQRKDDRAKPTIRARAAALRLKLADAFRGHRTGEVTDQPQSEALPEGVVVETAALGFQSKGPISHGVLRGYSGQLSRTDVAVGCKPLQELTMGRHEIFDTSRRAVVVGSLASAVPFPAFALAAPAITAVKPHPDQALLDAEVEFLRACAAAEAASEASSGARTAMRDALGPFPEELVMRGWEAIAFSKFYSPGFVRRVPTHIVPREDRMGNPDLGWTAEGLRQAIKLAPSAFGRAGQTPHEIRRWRGLLPLAEAYDTRRTDLLRRFRCQELTAEAEAAEKAQRRAARQIHDIPATTVDGLAVHTRRLASTAWYQDNSSYTALLLSAAAITGVALRQSDFAVADWLAAWEQIGGKVEWWAKSEEWAYIAPPVTADDPQERKDEVRRLTSERGSNSAVVHRWLEDRKSDPRFARA